MVIWYGEVLLCNQIQQDDELSIAPACIGLFMFVVLP